MELLVFGTGGQRVMVFPSREQRFFEYEDRGMVHSLRARLEAGDLQLFCVDGVDSESLYCFAKPPEERLARQLQYEQYIVDEAIPFSAAMNPGAADRARLLARRVPGGDARVAQSATFQEGRRLLRPLRPDAGDR